MKVTVFATSILVILLISILPITASAQPSSVPSEVVIGFHTADDAIRKDIVAKGGKVVDEIPQTRMLLVKVAGAAEDQFIKAMQRNPNVRFAERNHVVEAFLTPNDQYWDRLWGMRNIQADYAWSKTTGSTSVIVAVVDTGVQYTHPDLVGRVVKGYDFINNDFDPYDDAGHGTHVAGTIAATINNGIGVVGVAQATILAEKVLDSRGYGTDFSVAQGIINATDYGADVINLSLGASDDLPSTREAAQYAWDQNVLVIAAAGNSNTNNPNYPAAYDTVMAVTATNRDDQKASYSNYGNYIEISAPGGDSSRGGSYSTTYILSTYPTNTYAFAIGTSMATPHVSGVAALILSQNSVLTNLEVRNHLKATADDLGSPGWDQYYGYGRVNAYNAVTQTPPGTDTVPPVISNVAVTGVTLSSATVTWTTDEPSNSVVNYGISAALGSLRSDANLVTSHSVVLSGLASDTSHYFEVQSTDASANTEVDNRGGFYYTFTTLAEDTTPPAQVTGLDVTTVSSSQLDLAWNANTEPDLDHYNIYRSTTSGSGNLIAQTTSNTYSDTGLQASTTYYYQVSAVNESGDEGLPSSEESGTTGQATTSLMHVQSIEMSKALRGKSRSGDVYATVGIVDSGGAAVSGSTVYLTFTGDDGTPSYTNGVTGSDGKVTFKYTKVKVGVTYTATVTSVVKDGWIYDLDANVETSDFITV